MQMKYQIKTIIEETILLGLVVHVLEISSCNQSDQTLTSFRCTILISPQLFDREDSQPGS